MSTWKQFWFQDSASPIMEEFLNFHDLVFMVMIFVLTMVLGTFALMAAHNTVDHSLLEGQVIEWFWTVIPGGFLFLVAVPSLSLMYMHDETNNYAISVKAMGHQWYWSYEMMKYLGGELGSIEFDSYMTPTSELSLDGFRLLDTDTRLVIPVSAPIQLMVSSSDVLHSWAMPALGMKIDAVPGRLNMITLYSYNSGLFFGQCSEICGANHSFMPIVLEIIGGTDYVSWLMGA